MIYAFIIYYVIGVGLVLHYHDVLAEIAEDEFAKSKIEDEGLDHRVNTIAFNIGTLLFALIWPYFFLKIGNSKKKGN